MSQIDLFGNIVSSPQAPKKFSLKLLPDASYTDKKKKTEINSIVKELNTVQNILDTLRKQIDKTKSIYFHLLEPYSIELERKTIACLELILKHLNENKLKVWQIELLLHLADYEINTYFQFNLTPSKITHVNKEIQEFKNTLTTPTYHTVDQRVDKSEYSFYENNVTNPHNTSETDAVEIKFKRLYKTLVKQIHPDVLPFTSEENDQYIKALTQAWETKDYYQLLKLNHQIRPDCEIELSTGDLNAILKQIQHEYEQIQIEIQTVKSSPDYQFYFEQFYNTSDTVIKSKIRTFKVLITDKTKEVRNNISSHFNTYTELNHYLETQRVHLSEMLDIKYLIEDLYYSER